MFQKLITYSIRHKLVIGVLSIALAIWGVWSLVHLPFDSTPDITDNQVQVITQAPSLGAQEVEQYVTTPVEMALANIPRIQERRSISRSGLSVITLVFDDAADIYWARSQVSQDWAKSTTIPFVPRRDTSINTRLPSSEPCRTGLCANSFPEPRVLPR